MSLRPRNLSSLSQRLPTALSLISSYKPLPTRLSQSIPRWRHQHSSITPFSTTSVFCNKYSISDLSDMNYQITSEEAMQSLTDYLEEFIEDHSKDLADWEIEYSSGVLTLSTGETGTYVINKQPPNRQIWLSSPISGPKRFDYDKDKNVWFYTRDDTLLADLLDEELSHLSQRTVKVDLTYS